MDVIYESLISYLKEHHVYCLPDDIVAISHGFGGCNLHLINGGSKSIDISNDPNDYNFLNNFIEYKKYMRNPKLNQDNTN